jgi:hypothetical protein
MVDCCCICLSDLVPDETAIVCSELHTVCHGCFGRLYAQEHNWNGGGLCPFDRKPLLKLDWTNAFGDTLPQPYRGQVEASHLAHDAEVALQLAAPPVPARVPMGPPAGPPLFVEKFGPFGRGGHGRDLASLGGDPVERMRLGDIPQQNGLPDVREAASHGRKRTIQELTDAINSVAQEHTRRWKAAVRVWNRDQGKLRTRIWRYKRKPDRTAEGLAELERKLNDWETRNLRPRRDQFAPL